MMHFSLFDPVELLRYLQVALGIGLVIFVHELGHFIAARACGVRVELFSLGFGPRLIGWTRGATTYQLALVPLGGFVKMAGEETPAGIAPAPDELPAKSVGQRFFIYSGGVLMNVVFALVLFPPLLFFGVPFPTPTIGSTAPGGPAWKAGIEPGTRVLAVEGEQVYSFDSLISEVALSTGDELELLVRAPGATEDSVVPVRPEYDKARGLRWIGVEFASDPEGRVNVTKGSPAFLAGLREGDRVVAVNGRPDELVPTLEHAERRAEPLRLTVRRGEAAPQEIAIEPTHVTAKKQGLMLGIGPAVCRVSALRAGDAVQRLGLRAEDRLWQVDGKPLVREEDFGAALKQSLGRPFQMLVVREGVESNVAVEALDARLVAEALRDVALEPDPDDTRIALEPTGAAAKAGLRDTDRVVRIGDRPVKRWEEVSPAVKAQVRAEESLDVQVERRGADGKPQYVEIAVVPKLQDIPVYGMTFRVASYVYRAGTFVEAVRVGTRSSWKFLADGWNTLRGLVLGNVSSNSFGGIILISQVSYAFASMGVAKLLFFLCMLSLNLAFLNVLPIPVLDGGHLFFLLIEKVKGSPVNERVLGYSQMVGLVLILGLVVFVTFNDLRRILE